MIQHLEPCPHCRGIAEMDTLWTYRAISDGVCIYCLSCDAQMMRCYADYPGEEREDICAALVAAWNTRTPPKTQAPETGATPDTSTLSPQGDLGSSGGFVEHLKTRWTMIDGVPTPDEDCRLAAAEIDRLNKCLHYEQHLATHIGTHGPGCHNWGPQHYECAVREIATLTAKLKLAREGLHDILMDCQGPAYGWVEARVVRILKAIGGDL